MTTFSAVSPNTSIYTVLEDIKGKEYNKYKISKYEDLTLTAWDEFHKNVNPKVLGFPVWVFEFGETYDYSNFPKWKQDYVRKNRKLYLDNKKFIDKWMIKYDVNNFKLRDKKFEWQAGEKYNSVWETSIQLRQSGIRCKKPDYFPTLVAMVQTPIIGKYKRRMTPREVARLQSFPDTFIINKDNQHAYKQFGNSANVEIIKFLSKQLLIDIVGDRMTHSLSLYKHIIDGKIKDTTIPHPLEGHYDKQIFIKRFISHFEGMTYEDISNGNNKLYKINYNNCSYNIYIEAFDGGGRDRTDGSKKISITSSKSFKKLIENGESVLVVNEYVPLH